jgi:DNA-binding transcriptional LysR family regulator
MKRVSQLWNWLPTFRAAGETELLSRAGDDLGVSTSAVSRTVRLLEEDLGVPLFERLGRSVRLNAAGLAFLNATRNAMRVVDEAISEVHGNPSRGVVRIACDEPFATLFLLPVLPGLHRAHPGLLPHITSSAGHDLATLLRKGDIDVAVSAHETAAHGLESHFLGLVPSSFYIGPNHPLYRARSITHDALDRCTRAVLGRDAARGELTLDAQIGLVVDDLSALAAAVHGGEYLALLPDAVAACQPALRRVQQNARAPLNAFVARRERLSVRTRADLVIDAMLDHVRSHSSG